MTLADHARIGKYEILSPLAAGGMARVYLALARGPASFNKLVAIKQIRAELARDREFIEMFFDEARIVARLNHPNVVHTYEVLEDSGEYLLVMEYLDGQPLSDVLRRVRRDAVPLEEHLWILTQVLAGIGHAHRMPDFNGTPLGIVHRDISPSNVFITHGGEVKLLDFGIAKAIGALSATQHGAIKGKLGYAAPEQCLGQPVDERTDLFAVGVMLWEALAGRRRNFSGNMGVMFQARISGTEPKIRDVAPEVPSQLAEICDRATEVDPNRRYATAEQFQHDLEAYLASLARRVGAPDVAALLASYFSEERLARTKLIEERLSSAPVSSRSPNGLPAPFAVEIRPDSMASSLDVSRPVGRNLISRPGVRSWLAFAALSVFVASAGVAIFSRNPRLDPNLTTDINANRSALPRPRPSTTSPPHATPVSVSVVSPRADRVEFMVSVRPRSATLTLDGKRLASNPFLAEVPLDAGTHVLRASAFGFQSVERLVTFSKSQSLELTLPTVAKKTRTSEQPLERGAAALQRPAERRESLEPGMDLTRTVFARPRRQIDDKDPYSP